MSIHASTEDQKDLRYVLSALPGDKVPSLLDKAVRRFNRAVGKDLAEPQDYILKVCGLDEYLLGDYPLIQYKVRPTSVCVSFMPLLSASREQCLKAAMHYSHWYPSPLCTWNILLSTFTCHPLYPREIGPKRKVIHRVIRAVH